MSEHCPDCGPRRPYEYPHVRWCPALAASYARSGAAKTVIVERRFRPVYVALATGSREGVPARAVEDRLEALAEAVLKGVGALLVLRHGGARGVDKRVGAWARRSGESGWQIVEDPHPVAPLEWKTTGKRAGHLRNQRMVDASPRPDVCLAFPAPGGSAGTADCMRRAREAGIRVDDGSGATS